MIYLVQEAGKDGGTEYEHPDDAIDAAVAWELATGKTCDIYMRWRLWEQDVLLWSGPHNAAVLRAVKWARENPGLSI